MYDFFLRTLGYKSGHTTNATEWWPLDQVGNLTALYSVDQLQVTSTGQVVSAPECRPNLIYHNFTARITMANVAKIQAQRRDGAKGFLARVKAEAADMIGGLEWVRR